MKKIIGAEFFVERRLAEMESRFAAADLWGAKIYVDDDVRSNITLPDDFIKNYTGQKSITIEPKYAKPIKGVKISVAMFFISNHAFTVQGGVEGIERRMIYIPYKVKIENPDTYLKEKICGEKKKTRESGKYAGKIFDERPAIIGLALRGLDLFIKNDYNFVMPEWVLEERKEWIIQSNSITQFLYEVIYCGEETSYLRKELYDKYKNWCKEEDRHQYGRNNFYEKLKLESRIKAVHILDGDYFKIEDDYDLDDLPL
jgi:putative DNA primase/helicase